MDSREQQREKRARIAEELGRMLQNQARREWSGVRTARRRERGHHVWRFRLAPDSRERFLHVAHGAMDRANGRALFEQLSAGGWLDRLGEGGETALRLSAAGRLETWPAA